MTEWRRIRAKNVPVPRAAHSLDVVDASTLVMFGGFDGSVPLGDCHTYHVPSESWREVQSSICPCPRNNHTTFVSPDYGLYVHGGHSGARWLGDLWKLDLSAVVKGAAVNASWQLVKPGGRIPAARASHTITRIKKRAYLFGGFNGEKCFGDVDVFELGNDLWSAAPTRGSAPSPRNAHGAAPSGNLLVVLGGHNSKEHLRDCYVLDTVKFQWAQIKLSGLPVVGIRGHTLNFVGGDSFFAFGGFDGKERLGAAELTLSPPMWKALEDSPVSARQKHTCVGMAEHQILIFGGFDGADWLNDLWMYDLRRRTASCLEGQEATRVITNVKRLFHNSEFADVNFRMHDGGLVRAHKCILAAQCPFFQSLFMSEMKETRMQEIPFDFDTAPFTACLEFIYSGSVEGLTDWPLAQLLELVPVLDFLRLAPMWPTVTTVMGTRITVENVCAVARISDEYFLSDLKKKCFEFILDHSAAVSQSVGFEQLTDCPRLAVEIARLSFKGS
ncbi:MAG: uncharacterized protein KVP18_001941 [Porospora cf. gigantea A]|uniref:uncharacterized protein n=1 Tax=Porospora cf. gigantea A TaxID=2853593 RepID=UPI00355A40FA|nr:MAG: hypothetical protein KVP18_001941 [Porospora cf. gigantea A]